MSELINNSEKRLEDLLALSLGMMSGESGKMLIEKYADAIAHVTPHDMVKLEDRQMKMGISPAEIKKDVNKVINVLFNGLKAYQWEKPQEGTFLYYLMLENRAFEFRLNAVKKIMKSYKGREVSDFELFKGELLERFEVFQEFESHYVKKENILFPLLEKKWENYRPLKVMWSLHDDLRRKLKEVIRSCREGSSWAELNRGIGAYYFLAFGMIQKEELIVYPIASETVLKEEWEELHSQSFEYPFPFIESPARHETADKSITGKPTEISRLDDNLFIKTETGELNAEQFLLVMNNLPLDITFVDEHNKVRFFSKPKERFFPRSPAIIGRDVQNCHPPESVHIVNQIVDAFRKGERDKAEFWLELKGKFILIQYFALRNVANEYKGVIEVSQDVTGIRLLEGEQRLLDWN